MHLREYVRADDIDLAIQVTVGSFVNAQKMSIKKTLERVSGVFSSRPCLVTLEDSLYSVVALQPPLFCSAQAILYSFVWCLLSLIHFPSRVVKDPASP